MNNAIIAAMIRRYLYHMKHDLNSIAEAFYEPSMQILIWGLTSVYISSIAENFPQIISIMLSGVIFWMVITHGEYSIAVNLLYDLWDRNIVNIFVSPMRIREWIISVMIVGMIKIFFALIFGLILTLLLYKTNLFRYGLLIIPFTLNLVIMGWVVGFIMSGLIIRFGFKVQAIAWTMVPLFIPFSAVYFPVATLPLWARDIAAIVPASYIFEGMREIIFTGNFSYDKLLISFALNIVYLILSISFFVFMFNQSKKLGLGRLV